MYHMSDKTRQNIERIVGLPSEEIRQLTPQNEIKLVKTRTGKTLRWPKTTKTRTINDLNRKSKALFGV